MQPKTRELFNAIKFSLAHDNGVQDVSEKFNYAQPVEQRTVDGLGERSDFLKNINMLPVTEQKGVKLGLNIGKPVASRTNTEEKDRESKWVGDLDQDGYECVQVNSDVHLPYRILDVWGNDNDFANRYRAHHSQRQARDAIMIGWNGITAAAETDMQANPLLEDVNVGWLEKIRAKKPASIMGYQTDGTEEDTTYKVGAGGDYGTLDSLVFDAMSNLLDPWYMGAEDLVLIVGRELWTKHGLTLFNESRSATERNALVTWMAREAIAGLPTITVPYFPARGVLITSYDNLSLYYQGGAMRRAIIDNPKRDRIEEYFSMNTAYVIEDYGKACGVRNGTILLKNEAGEWV